MDKKIKKLASNLLNHSVKLKKGEKVLIEMLGTDCTNLSSELIKQATTLESPIPMIPLKYDSWEKYKDQREYLALKNILFSLNINEID